MFKFLLFLCLLIYPSTSFSDQVEQRPLLILNTYQQNGIYYSTFKDLQNQKTYRQESCYKLKRYNSKKLYAFFDITRNMYFISCTFI